MLFKTVKPFFSDKVTSLIEEGEIIRNDSDTARVLNTFFSNIISNLKMPEYTKCELRIYQRPSFKIYSKIKKPS